MVGPIAAQTDWTALIVGPFGLIVGLAVLFVTIVFLDRASKRRARDRERHLRALEKIAAQNVANSRQDQPGRDS